MCFEGANILRDELGVIYPTIVIRSFSDGNITIDNTTTGNSLSVNNCLVGETITIDGEHKIITTDKEDHATLSNDFNYEYFDILIDEYNTANKYEVSAPCEISVHYSPIRKVGVY